MAEQESNLALVISEDNALAQATRALMDEESGDLTEQQQLSATAIGFRLADAVMNVWNFFWKNNDRWKVPPSPQGVFGALNPTDIIGGGDVARIPSAVVPCIVKAAQITLEVRTVYYGEHTHNLEQERLAVRMERLLEEHQEQVETDITKLYHPIYDVGEALGGTVLAKVQQLQKDGGVRNAKPQNIDTVYDVLKPLSPELFMAVMQRTISRTAMFAALTNKRFDTEVPYFDRMEQMWREVVLAGATDIIVATFSPEDDMEVIEKTHS